MMSIARALNQLKPKSMRARLIILLMSAVVIAQILSSLLWVTQLKNRHAENVLTMVNQIAYSISSTVGFFESLPVEYRHIVLDQLRRMGGSRFFVTLNNEYIDITPISNSELKKSVILEVERVIRSELGSDIELLTDFSLAKTLKVFNNDINLLDLPPGWGHHSLLLDPDKTPILVVQVNLHRDEWLYLATLLPTNNGLLDSEYLPREQFLFMGFTVVMVLLVALIMVRSLTRPLKVLSLAAEELGKDIDRPPLPVVGSTEVKAAAKTFNAMQSRIKKHMKDRESLFSAISHDLKTPITRLRFRTEMLEDETQKEKFEQDLIELEVMVQGALQIVKGTAIDENTESIDLQIMIQQICDGANIKNNWVSFQCDSNRPYQGKPIALKRAITNIVENAVFYGHQAKISLYEEENQLVIEVRDYGPGVPDRELNRIFEPYVRLEKSRNRNTGGSGLGLSIARNIIQAHEGTLTVENHPKRGLVVLIKLPHLWEPKTHRS